MIQRADALDRLISLGDHYRNEGDHKAAAVLYSLALRVAPERGEILERLRSLDMAPEDEEDAFQGVDLPVEMARTALRDSSHLLGLAHLYADRSEEDSALECVALAIQRGVDGPGHHKLAGQIFYRRGEVDRAIRHFEHVLELNPFERDTAELLGQLELARRNFRAALLNTTRAYLLLQDRESPPGRVIWKRIRKICEVTGVSQKELADLFTACQVELQRATVAVVGTDDAGSEELHDDAGPLPPQPAQPILPAEPRTPADIASYLSELRPFAHFDPAALAALAGVAVEEIFQAQDLIAVEGQTRKDLFLIEAGEVVNRKRTPYGGFTLARQTRDDLFGEANFIRDEGRSTDAQAAVDTRLICFPSDKVRALIADNHRLAVDLHRALLFSMSQKLRETNDVLNTFFGQEGTAAAETTLDQDPMSQAEIEVDPEEKKRLFAEHGLTYEEIGALATYSKEILVPREAYLFREGEPGEEMYIVLDGKILISKFIPGGGEEALAILGHGDFFGEMSLIDGAPRSASARAHEGPATVVAISQDSLDKTFAANPEHGFPFIQLLCRLLAARLTEVREKVITWAILSGHRGDVDLV